MLDLLKVLFNTQQEDPSHSMLLYTTLSMSTSSKKKQRTISQTVLSLLLGGGNECCFKCANNWSKSRKVKLATSIDNCVVGCRYLGTLPTMLYLSNMIGNQKYQSTKNDNNGSKKKTQQRFLLPPLSDHNDEHLTIIVCRKCFFRAIGMNKYYRDY